LVGLLLKTQKAGIPKVEGGRRGQSHTPLTRHVTEVDFKEEKSRKEVNGREVLLNFGGWKINN